MNNNPSTSHVSFSDDSDATFLIRWRGRQEGPYTAAVIETKLAANQIGLLHEISHNGQWVTLRDYFAEREAIVRAQRQAREEQERRAREEAERQAKEREEQRRAQLVAIENKKSASSMQEVVPMRSSPPSEELQRLLFYGVCVVSMLAFFMPNITFTTTVLGTQAEGGVSMFDFIFGSNRVDANAGQKFWPSSGDRICDLSWLALLGHFLLTVVWIIKSVISKNGSFAFNVVWLGLGAQFPVLFAIGTHVATAGQIANNKAVKTGWLYDLAKDLIYVHPGTVTWFLMACCLAALVVPSFRRTHIHREKADYGSIPQ